MKFTLTKDAKVLFYQLCLTLTITLMLYHFDILFFIKIELDAFDFIILEILSQ